MKTNIVDWDATLNDLISLYRDVERRSLSLSMISITPFLVGLWSYIKFQLAFLVDVLLLIPMNFIIFLRNLFPGKWQYQSFSWPYIKYAINWIWRGETPTFPILVIQPLVSMMISIHAHNRFLLIGKYILLDDQINDEQRDRLNTKLHKVLENYKRPNILNYIYTFFLPITGPLIEGYKWFFPNEIPIWLNIVGIPLISYTILFVVSAIVVKRGLMLGGEGRASYFPGALVGNQFYGKEKQILNSVGIKKTEFPLDILLCSINLLIVILSTSTQLQAYGSAELPTSAQITQQNIITSI